MSTHTSELLAALKLAEQTIAGTLEARGYERGSCTDEWVDCVRKEVATLAVIQNLLAKQRMVVCPHCDGTVESETCPLCHGKRVVLEAMS